MKCQFSTHGFCESFTDAACLCDGGPADGIDDTLLAQEEYEEELYRQPGDPRD